MDDSNDQATHDALGGWIVNAVQAVRSEMDGTPECEAWIAEAASAIRASGRRTAWLNGADPRPEILEGRGLFPDAQHIRFRMELHLLRAAGVPHE